jgi:hypothetical protein
MLLRNLIIALTCRRFESHSIRDCDLPMRIANVSGALQGRSCNSDAGAATSEHRGKKFVGHRKVAPTDPIVSHQQPARASFEHAVEKTARAKAFFAGPLTLRLTVLYRPKSLVTPIEDPPAYIAWLIGACKAKDAGVASIIDDAAISPSGCVLRCKSSST